MKDDFRVLYELPVGILDLVRSHFLSLVVLELFLKAETLTWQEGGGNSILGRGNSILGKYFSNYDQGPALLFTPSVLLGRKTFPLPF